MIKISGKLQLHLHLFIKAWPCSSRNYHTGAKPVDGTFDWTFKQNHWVWGSKGANATEEFDGSNFKALCIPILIDIARVMPWARSPPVHHLSQVTIEKQTAASCDIVKVMFQRANNMQQWSRALRQVPKLPVVYLQCSKAQCAGLFEQSRTTLMSMCSWL